MGDIDLILIFFVAVSIHGLVLGSLFFIDKRDKTRATRLIGLICIAFSVELLKYCYLWRVFTPDFDWVTYYSQGFALSSGFHLFYGPWLISYLRAKYLKRGPVSRVHYIPGVLIIILFIPYLFISSSAGDDLFAKYLQWKVPELLHSMSIIQLTGYSIFAIRMRGKIVKMLDLDSRHGNWLWALVINFAIYSAGFILYHLMNGLSILTLGIDFVVSGMMAFGIYSMAYLGYFRPELIERATIQRYQNSKIPDNVLLPKLDQFNQLMENEKIFLESDLTLAKAADYLGISSHYLTQVIQYGFRTNFSELIATYRVKEAKCLLETLNSVRRICSQLVLAADLAAGLTST